MEKIPDSIMVVVLFLPIIAHWLQKSYVLACLYATVASALLITLSLLASAEYSGMAEAWRILWGGMIFFSMMPLILSMLIGLPFCITRKYKANRCK